MSILEMKWATPYGLRMSHLRYILYVVLLHTMMGCLKPLVSVCVPLVVSCDRLVQHGPVLIYTRFNYHIRYILYKRHTYIFNVIDLSTDFSFCLFFLDFNCLVCAINFLHE